MKACFQIAEREFFMQNIYISRYRFVRIAN